MADGGKFLHRDLQQRKPRILEQRYRTLYNTEDIPTQFDIEMGITELVQPIFETVGNAAIIADTAFDFPGVDVGASEDTYKVVMIGSSFSYTLQNEQSLAYRNANIDDRKMSACTRAIAEKWSSIMYYGASSVGFTGLLNNGNITPEDSSFDPFGAGATANSLIEFFMDKVQEVYTGSNLTERVDTIRISPELDYQLMTKFLENSGQSAKAYLQQQGLSVEARLECRAANLAANNIGVAGKDRILFYPRDPEVIEGHATLPDLAPPDYVQVSGLKRTFPMYAYTSPTIINFPRAVAYVDVPQKPAA